MNLLNVTSEIGELKKVLLHRPGREIENLTPKFLAELLFDDIPWLDLAQKEHDAFAKVFKDNGVEVLYLTDLVAESLAVSKEIKLQFIEQFIEESLVTSDTLKEKLAEYLLSIPSNKELVSRTMAGVKKIEIPNFEKRTLSDYIRDYPFVTDPMPNLYFTRDPFAVINGGVAISKMFSQTRSRETIYGEYIFKYHPIYSDKSIPKYYDRNMLSAIEGGDVLVLSEKVLALGVSQRTHPASIEKLAKSLFYDNKTNYEVILAFDIPKIRSFMHLDTVFTQVDYDKFLIHHDVQTIIKAYEIRRNPLLKGKLTVLPVEGKLDEILSKHLGMKVTLIPCGGEDSIAAAREQWNDGANTIALRPGEVIVYERNHITNNLLQEHGIKVHTIPSSELSRGRGGPRCMSMPFVRGNLK
ncbi:MAG: arginine deiminase [Tenericutes bacterium]|nr:arginine deiminase [Mycoplasmatota bacterium]